MALTLVGVVSYNDPTSDTALVFDWGVNSKPGYGEVLYWLTFERTHRAIVTHATDWTWVATNFGGTTMQINMHRKVSTGNEPQTYTHTMEGTTPASSLIFRFAEALPAPDGRSEDGQPNGVPLSFPSLTPTKLQEMLLAAYTAQNATTFTEPVGMTELFDGTAGSSTTARTYGAASELRTDLTPTGARSPVPFDDQAKGGQMWLVPTGPPTTTQYVLKAANSDLSGGADFNKVLSEGTEAATGIPLTVAANATEESHAFTQPNIPSNQGGSPGSTVYVAKANISAGGANLRYLNVGVARVNSLGVVQAGPFFGTEVTASTAIHTFNITANLGTFAVGDRFRITYRFREGNGISWSPTLQAGTLNTSVVVPWALDVDPPAIPTGLIGAGLSHN